MNNKGRPAAMAAGVLVLANAIDYAADAGIGSGVVLSGAVGIGMIVVFGRRRPAPTR